MFLRLLASFAVAQFINQTVSELPASSRGPQGVGNLLILIPRKQTGQIVGRYKRSYVQRRVVCSIIQKPSAPPSEASVNIYLTLGALLKAKNNKDEEKIS